MRSPDRAFSACASDVNNYSTRCVTSRNIGFRSKLPMQGQNVTILCHYIIQYLINGLNARPG